MGDGHTNDRGTYASLFGKANVKDLDANHEQDEKAARRHGTVLLHPHLPRHLLGAPLEVLGLAL